MKQVLLYLHENSLNLDCIYTFLERKNIYYTVVSDDELSCHINTLFTNKNKKGNTSKAFSFDFILFSDFSKDEIMSFLNEANEESITFSHKAILTENNQDWTLSSLLQEIEEEHTFFTKWEKLHALLKEANDIDSSLYAKESFEPYKQSFLRAYMFTKAPQKDYIDEIIQDLEITKNNLEMRKD